MDATVEHGLHPARAAGLVGSPRRVEPHVGPGVKAAAYGDVVVLDERHAPTNLRTPGELHDLLDELLALVVGGVRLAGEHQLHGPLRGQQQRLEAFGLRQEQRRPLVGGEAPSEPDGEYVGVEFDAGPGPDELDQLPAAL